MQYEILGLHLISNIPLSLPASRNKRPGNTTCYITFCCDPSFKELPTSSAKLMAEMGDYDTLVVRYYEQNNHYLLRMYDFTQKEPSLRLEYAYSPDGSEIMCTVTCEGVLKRTADLFLNWALVFALQLAGVPCFHANALAFSNTGCVIMGPSGIGKSTLTLACLQHGAAFMSDDISVFTRGNRGYYLQPSLPRLKLKPEMIKQLSASCPIIVPNYYDHEKTIVQIDDSWSTYRARPCPAKAIYLPSPNELAGTKIVVSSLDKQESLKAIMMNTVKPFLLPSSQRDKCLFTCCRLVEKIAVKRLLYPKRVERLGAVVNTIWRDLKTL